MTPVGWQRRGVPNKSSTGLVPTPPPPQGSRLPDRAELGRKYLCFTWHLGPGTLVRPLIRTPSKLQICPECRVRGHVGPQEARLAERVRL